MTFYEKLYLGQQCMAYILLNSLLLQSCNSPSLLNSPSKQVPIAEKQLPINLAYTEEEAIQERENLSKSEKSTALELVGALSRAMVFG